MLIHPLLLAGLVLAGIPVLIHLIMQQKPKRLAFPAFRFLQQRYRTNRTSLRLRHLLLLLLRLGLLILLCLALARPRLFSERLNLTSDSPVDAVLVFDTSPSMEYRVADRSRLEEAKRRAGELLNEMPPDSRVAVLDSADSGGEWLPPSQARERLTRLQPRPANAPVTHQLAQAYRLFDSLSQEQDQTSAWPRFLYVFSDRTPASWDPGPVKELPQAITAGINAVFVDVGVDKPADLAITNLELPHPVIGPEDRLEVLVTVQATGLDGDTFLTCSIDGETPGEQRPLQRRAGQSAVEHFERPVAGLAPGPHHLEVRLGSNDSLAFDDVRFATFVVRGDRGVLAVADQARDARIWKLALDTAHRFHCDILSPADVGKLDPLALLARYRVVCLLDVAAPEAELWNLLSAYVQHGGSLALVPGANLQPPTYATEPATHLVPARFKQLLVTAEATPALPWREQDSPSLFLAPFREWKRTASVDFFQPESLPRVARYWKVVPADNASVLVTYANRANDPALVERSVGQGRVLLFTTGFDGRQGEHDVPWWNNYLQSSFYPVLVNEAVGYLAGDAEEPALNYLAGQAVLLKLPPAPRFPMYTLQGPGLSGSEAAVPHSEEQPGLQITQAQAPGNYLLLDGNNHVVAGFSINVRPEECQLTRDPETVHQIEAVLGPDTVLTVSQTGSLRTALQGHWRQPLELLPGLLILVLLLLALENLLANRFYHSEERMKEEG